MNSDQYLWDHELHWQLAFSHHRAHADEVSVHTKTCQEWLVLRVHGHVVRARNHRPVHDQLHHEILFPLHPTVKSDGVAIFQDVIISWRLTEVLSGTSVIGGSK